MRIFLLILLLTLQATPNMTVAWQRDTLHITWQAPGYHCVWIDQYPLTCGVNSGGVDIPARGIDTAYQPRAGRVLRLIDEGQTKPRGRWCLRGCFGYGFLLSGSEPRFTFSGAASHQS